MLPYESTKKVSSLLPVQSNPRLTLTFVRLQVTTSAASDSASKDPCLKDGLTFFSKMGYKRGQTCRSLISDSPFSPDEIHISKCEPIIDQFEPLVTALSDLLLTTDFLEEYLLIALSLVSLTILLTTLTLYYIRQSKRQLMMYLHELDNPVQQRYAPVISNPTDPNFELPPRNYLSTPYVPSNPAPTVTPGSIIASAPIFSTNSISKNIRDQKRSSYISRY